MRQFLQELKRRHVIRVGIAYLAVAWLIIQVAETLLPVYGFEDAAVRNLVTLLAVGFLLAVVLSWFFEWNAAGIFRDEDAPPAEAADARGTHRFDRFIIVVLAVAIGYFCIDKFVLDPSRDAANIEAAMELGRAEAFTANFKHSVAVLPFANRSDDQSNAYFVDGIHDDILTQLAGISDLSVTSRTSVEQYRGTTENVAVIAEQLGVRAILEGGVQRSGDRVRINIQLIDAGEDRHLWAETYVRELTTENIFGVQADIASSVAEALQATLLPAEAAALDQPPTASLPAYDHYQQGRWHMRKRDLESLEKARDNFLLAVEKDPDYVLALSGLADTYGLLIEYGTIPGEEAIPLAEAAIEQAMSVDDQVAEVWASKGLVNLYKRQVVESENALIRAIELDDEYVWAYHWYSIILDIQNRMPEALRASRKAHELEPMLEQVNEMLAIIYFDLGEFARARHHMDLIAQANASRQTMMQLWVAASQFESGDLARAVQTLRQSLAAEPGDVALMNHLGRTYLTLLDPAAAAEWYRRIPINSTSHFEHYRLYEATGDFERLVPYWETKLRLMAPQRPPFIVANLVRARYLVGDIEGAREYLDEYLELLQGRVEVDYRNDTQIEPLSIASFWIQHGRTTVDEAERGYQLAEDIKAALLEQYRQGVRHPDLLISLAAAESLLGDLDQAFEYMEASIDAGFRNQDQVLTFPAFDLLRGDQRLAAASERVDGLVGRERETLERLELAPYSPPQEREPTVVARTTLERYVGHYSDRNMITRHWIADDGQFMIQRGSFSEQPMLALSDTTFFVEADAEATYEFVMDNEETASHYMLTTSTSSQIFKRIEAPAPAVDLPRDALERFAGQYAGDRLGGATGEREESDIWVINIYVDDDGVLWFDPDDQSRLQAVAISDTEARLVGFLSHFTFEFDDNRHSAARFVISASGFNVTFDRQTTETTD
ncbi:MAG: tetratricopeptide repeat protein [Pseudomonadota bacterium]